MIQKLRVKQVMVPGLTDHLFPSRHFLLKVNNRTLDQRVKYDSIVNFEHVIAGSGSTYAKFSKKATFLNL